MKVTWLSDTQKTIAWYLLGPYFKISDEHTHDVYLLIGGIRDSVKANNQTRNKIEITTFTSIMVWGSDTVSQNLCIEKSH